MRLFLCEKPSQGKDIGRILGATQRGEGCLNGSGVTVTWCIGHLVEAAAPEVYDAALKRWSLEQLPIIPQQWRVEVKPKTATQFKVVKALLAKATQLVIATDADREGELIAREIIDPRLKQKLKDTTGIGTEATRANIISGLIARGYI